MRIIDLHGSIVCAAVGRIHKEQRAAVASDVVAECSVTLRLGRLDRTIYNALKSNI